MSKRKKNRTLGKQPSCWQQTVNGLVLASALAVAPSVMAEDNADASTKRHYQISSGSLSHALSQFAGSAGILLSVDARLTDGKSSQGLTGEYSVEEGFRKLLSGTGLVHTFTSDNAVTLKVVENRSQADTATLAAVRVTGISSSELDPSEVYQLSKSTAGSRIPVKLEKIPQSIQVVTEKTIHDQAALDFGQVFKTVPSANVGQSRFSRFPNWTIRGFPVFIQRNGFRRLLQQSVDSSALSNVQSFEVLKGPGSALHGQGGLGGVVNIVTKQPKKQFEGWVSGTFGQYDLGMTTFDVTGPLTSDGALSGRLTGEIERSGSFIDHQDMERENLALNLLYDNGGPIRGHLVTEWISRRTLPNPGLPAIGTVVSNGIGKISRETYLGEPNSDRLEDNSPVVQAWLDIDINPNWTISPRLQYHGIDGYQNQTFLTSVQGNGYMVNRTGRHGFHEADRTYLAQLELTGKFDTFGVHHQFLGGLEYEDHRWGVEFTNYASVSAINVFNPQYWNTEPALAAAGLKGTGVLQNGSFYLQDLVSITDKLDFLGGMRHTQISGSTDYWFGKTDLQTDVTMFNIGSAYKLTDGISLFAGYGTGTDFDSFGALTFNPQTQYRPIESDQKEIGVKLNTDNGINGTVALYEIYRSNFLTPDTQHPGYQTQLGEARSRGVEAELNWQINEEWNVQGGYAFTDARITKSGAVNQLGNRMRNVAEHQANLWTHYEFQTGVLKGLGFGAGANFVGDRPGENFQPSYKLPSYTTVDLSASYIWKNIKTEIFALNILDKQYFTASDFTSNAVFSGAPQTVFGRVTLNF
ncbi:MAG: TonB-dependent receptor [Methylomonas sp.]|uniref:TonB-dependent siderophore receptor n=1 Tax=Methylomonas sp. TaxID=418 RepID=UPI0025E148D0|nr:TonB-dependent receptor [Methylomonas sp.]MCK9607666.1 TonB-dependent receptor [Methylomonas sp.]